jgi:tRNA (cmo5U34)-methyltransferase
MNKFTFATEEGGFDSHIAKSIRGYEDLCDDVVKFSEYYARESYDVVDLGCSTGRLLRRMKQQNKHVDCMYVGVENEPKFFDDLVEEDKLCFYKTDAKSVIYSNLCFVTSIFTLQFIDPTDRFSILRNIYSGLISGGAFIIAEKIYSPDVRMQDMMTFMYYDFKKKSFTEKEILDKEVKLRSMVKLYTEKELVGELASVGFNRIYPFWRNYNFVGYICHKD